MIGEAKRINKSAIKTFAIEARKILMKSAATEAGLYGISAEEIRKPVQRGLDFEVYETLAGTEKRIFRADMRRRANLVKAIEDRGFQEVIEETAYTWFNRLISIRFMEVNDYLPTRTRVLSSETGNNTPDLINEFLDVDLGMTDEEMQAVQTAKNENRYDDAFRLLFIKECNALNDVLPGLFEKTDDYMELLLTIPYTSDGVVRMLVDTIPEENFDVEKEGQIEIIGWLYQYYNTEPKAKAFAKKNEKITKEEIPAVTQLFTPDWIVRYMVENSLGRLWIEGHPDKDLKSNWKYYLNEAPQEPEVEKELAEIREGYKKLTPKDIKVIDPCMGSGHILVYLFEVLMQIYKQDGYTERDAVELILENNLYGLDIDDRAYQLSYFAVMMKARQYNRSILKKHPKCHIYAVQESNGISKKQLEVFGKDLSEIERNNARNQMEGLIDTFIDGKEYGSILKVEMCDWELLRKYVASDPIEGQITFETVGIDQVKERLEALIDIGETMAQKYDVVVTNPPYAAVSNLSEKLNAFVKKNYPDSKSDMSTVCMERATTFCKESGYWTMINIPGWMFLSSYGKLRGKLLNEQTLVNMVHPGRGIFGSDFGTTTFVFQNHAIGGYKGSYRRLFDKQGDVEGVEAREQAFLSGKGQFTADQTNFSRIPGSPVSYWVSKTIVKSFEEFSPLGNVAKLLAGTSTGDNTKYQRIWYEVSEGAISRCAPKDMSKRWYPCNTGGEFKKYTPNVDKVIDWENDGYRIKRQVNSRGNIGSAVRNRAFFFLDGITWNKLSSSNFGVRFLPKGYISDDTARVMIVPETEKEILFGFLCSKVCKYYLQLLSPTMSFTNAELERLPIADVEDKSVIRSKICKNSLLSQKDRDYYETSWDFKRHPMLNHRKITDAYTAWKSDCEARFLQLKVNEEELNHIFIDIYGLQDELTPDVADKDVTVHRVFDIKDDVPESMKGSNYVRTMRDEVVSLISYAVGCMFGRYSIHKDGIVYAGGDWSEKYGSYNGTFDDLKEYTFAETGNFTNGELSKKFCYLRSEDKKPLFCYHVDYDNIIPICDDEYFEDDIVGLFVKFVKTVYGEDTLEENLKFIADALGGKGTSREVIRKYFMDEFYKDHCKTYQKRPIYWLFDSGKQNGFKALIYMHRYTPDTVGLIRSMYLHKVQAAIETAKQNAEYVISTSSSATEKATSSKKRDKYIKQLNELRPYYQALSHVALQRIDMDLDNGVKANYQLFQNVEISTEGKKQKIDLLAKI